MKKFLLIATLVGLSSNAFGQGASIKSANHYEFSGVPSNGTSEIQTLTFGGTPTGGTFTIAFAGLRGTGPITWSATNATLIANIQAALVATNAVGANGVTVAAGSLSAGIGTVTITYQGKNGRQDFPDATVTNSLTGTSPTVSVATTTPGVRATFRQAGPGTILVDTATPGLYFNASATPYAPNWTAK